MIVSHSRRIIIFGNRKCGSTTVHRYLEHRNEMPESMFDFRNDSTAHATHYDGRPLPESLRRLLAGTHAQHWTGQQMHALFDHLGLPWDDYRKIVTIRNPWDRMVSTFMWMLKVENPHGVDLDQLDFTTPEELEAFLFTNRKIYSDPLPWFSGVVDGDYTAHGFELIRLEDFPERLPDLWADMTDEPMPEKVGFYNRTRHPSYVGCYTDRARDWVADAFAEDIRVGDYEYGMTPAPAGMRTWIAENT